MATRPDPRFWPSQATRRLQQWSGALLFAIGVYLTLKQIGHLAAISPTRGGKSRFFEWLTLNIALSPQKITTIFIDPHGHSSDELLGHFTAMGRLDRVVWLDLSESRKILAYNPVMAAPLELAGVRASAKASALLAAQGLADTESIDVMPRLRQSYSLIFQALIESGFTLNEAMYLTSTPTEPIRRAIIDRISSPYIAQYWRGIDQLKPTERLKQMNVLQARLHPFWATPQLYHMTGQSQRSVNMKALIESGKTIIVKAQPYRNLTHEDTRLMMSLLLEDLIAAVFSRPPHTGTPVVLIIDELADRVCGPDVAKTFRGSLKYGLHTFVGTQSLASLYEMQPELAREVMANATTKIVFRDCPYEDLEIIAKDMALQSLDFYALKDRIVSTKFRPVESSRTVTTYSESSSESSGNSSGNATGYAETSIPLQQPIFIDEELATINRSEIETSGQSSSKSHSSGYSSSEVPFIEFHEFREDSSRAYFTPEEQWLRIMQALKSLKPRQMALKQRGQKLRIVDAPFWPDLELSANRIDEALQRLLCESNLYGKIDAIQREQAHRLAQLTNHSHASNPALTTSDNDNDKDHWQ